MKGLSAYVQLPSMRLLYFILVLSYVKVFGRYITVVYYSEMRVHPYNALRMHSSPEPLCIYMCSAKL